MNVVAVKYNDIANGPGVRVSLFVSGCRFHCPNCFNREAWDFAYGEPYTPEIQEELLRSLERSQIAGLSLLGGEPFEPENRVALAQLLDEVRRRFPQKTVWCYSGFTFEQLMSEPTGQARALLSRLDVLVDGRFEESLKSPALLFRGSSNQRILDVPKSVQGGQPVWLAGKWERAMGSGNIYE